MMICTEFMKNLSKYCNPNQTVILFFDDGFIFKSKKNTGVFESTNSLELEDPNYIEFYDCAFEVSEILQFPLKINLEIKQGDYFAISDYGEPKKIETEDKNVIWQNQPQ